MGTFTAAIMLSMAPAVLTPIDFRLGGPTPQISHAVTFSDPARPIPIAPIAAPPGPDGGEGSRAEGTVGPAPRPSHFRIASGFGRDVPLAFATRQIVPAGVKVSYAPELDEQQPVTWTGGKPWDDVLRSAVKPLGLHVVVSHMAVRIAK